MRHILFPDGLGNETRKGGEKTRPLPVRTEESPLGWTLRVVSESVPERWGLVQVLVQK